MTGKDNKKKHFNTQEQGNFTREFKKVIDYFGSVAAIARHIGVKRESVVACQRFVARIPVKWCRSLKKEIPTLDARNLRPDLKDMPEIFSDPNKK